MICFPESMSVHRLRKILKNDNFMTQEFNPDKTDNVEQLLRDYDRQRGSSSSDGRRSTYTPPPRGTDAADASDAMYYQEWFDKHREGVGDSSEEGSFLTWLSLIQNLLKTGNVSSAFEMFRQGHGFLPSGDGAADQMKDIWLQMVAQSNSDRDFSRNSPQAQLQRLMATGMSREAALQALQGFESSAAPMPEGTAPSASSLAEQQAKTEQLNRSLGILGTVLGSVSSAVSIGQFGISLSKLFAEKAILSAGATNAQLSLQGVTAAAELSNAVTQTVDAAGNPLTADLLPPMSEGYDAFRSWLQSPQSDKNPYIAAFRQKYPDITGNPYFWDSARNNYNAWHNARNQDELDKQNAIQTELIGLQRDYQSIQLDIANLDFDFQSDTYEDRVRRVAVDLGVAEQTQSNLALEGDLLNQQLGIAKTQNKRSAMEFADYTKIHNVMNDANLAEFRLKFDKLTAYRDPTLIGKEVEALRRDYQFQATKAYFDDIEYQYERGYILDSKRDPKLQQSLQISRILHHYFDGYGFVGGLIGSLGNAAGQVFTAFTPSSAYGVTSVSGAGRSF